MRYMASLAAAVGRETPDRRKPLPYWRFPCRQPTLLVSCISLHRNVLGGRPFGHASAPGCLGPAPVPPRPTLAIRGGSRCLERRATSVLLDGGTSLRNLYGSP